MKTAIYTLTLTSVLLVISCRSAQKLVDEGRYDEAIVLPTKKMKGDRFKKAKHIKALESAFVKINRNDLDQIDYLKAIGDLEAWERIYVLGLAIERRQNKVAPFLPLISKDGYEDNFEFINADDMLLNGGKMIKNLSYQKGKELIGSSKQFGRKMDARQAHYALLRVLDFGEGFEDVDALLEEALLLGQEHILLETYFETNLFLPTEVKRFLEGIRYVPARDDWLQYYTDDEARKEFDYVARLRVGDIFISPEREKELIFLEDQEIEDGWEYALDSNGNVQKDTLGNDIRIPRYAVVEARVTEIFREKNLELRAELELLNVEENLRLIEPIIVRAIFEDYSCFVRGDRRALTERTRKRFKDYPAEFPTDFKLLLDTSNEVKRIFEKEVSRLVGRGVS